MTSVKRLIDFSFQCHVIIHVSSHIMELLGGTRVRTTESCNVVHLTKQLEQNALTAVGGTINVIPRVHISNRVR